MSDPAPPGGEPAFICVVEIPKAAGTSTSTLEHGKDAEVIGWRSRQDALEEIAASQRRFREQS